MQSDQYSQLLLLKPNKHHEKHFTDVEITSQRCKVTLAQPQEVDDVFKL